MLPLPSPPPPRIHFIELKGVQIKVAIGDLREGDLITRGSLLPK